MKALPFLFCLLVAILAVLAISPPVAEGQIFIPHVGKFMVSPTPTIEATVVITQTSTTTPTATLRATSTPSRTPTITQTPSDTPTITQTPTKTGTPTTTPTITPTPTDTIGNGVIVLNTHNAYVNEAGFVTVVGEVRNDTAYTVTNMIVTVTLYNNRTDVVDTLNTYVWLAVMAPRDKSCFEAVFQGEPTYNRYGFETQYTNTNATPRSLAILNHGGVYLSDKDAWHVTGQIGSTEDAEDEITTEPILYPQVIGTLYDETGQVMDCMYVTAYANQLAEGETSIWEMTFRSLPMDLAKVYRVQAK